MIAYMGTRKIVYPFSNAEELLRDTTLKVGCRFQGRDKSIANFLPEKFIFSRQVLVQFGTDLDLGFKNSPDPVLHEIYEDRMEPVNHLFSSVCRRRALKIPNIITRN